jgi:hypothetical protein
VYVGDTAPDNASSTQGARPVSYIEDGRIRAGDKCRSGQTTSASGHPISRRGSAARHFPT